MESVQSGETGCTESIAARMPIKPKFSGMRHWHDRQSTAYAITKTTDQIFRGHLMPADHAALQAAQREIECLRMLNLQLERQLEQAWEREADALAHAHRDELTGLPNRRLFKDRLTVAMAHADRESKSVALLLIDMDDFKNINDTLGHYAGDQLLVQVAQRLGKCLRAVDTACRYGGDEFVVIFSELGGEEAVEAVMAKVRECLLPPYRIDGRDMYVSASIGHAVYPQQAANGHVLINHADADMYRVKQLRKKQACTLR